MRNVNKFTGSYLKLYYKAYLASGQSGANIQVRAYANLQAYTNGYWALFISDTSTSYSLVGMYYASGSYADTAAPNLGASFSNIFSSSWVNTGGYAAITAVTSNSITVNLYRNTDFDFGYSFRVYFRFYT